MSNYKGSHQDLLLPAKMRKRIYQLSHVQQSYDSMQFWIRSVETTQLALTLHGEQEQSIAHLP
jgi:hypothetical protein